MKNQRRFAPTKPGRLAPEWVAAFLRNQWPESAEYAPIIPKTNAISVFMPLSSMPSGPSFLEAGASSHRCHPGFVTPSTIGFGFTVRIRQCVIWARSWIFC